MRVTFLIILAFAALVLPIAGVAVAAEATPSTVITIPWGDWLVTVARATVDVLLPVLLAAAAAAIFKLVPAAKLFLSTDLVERLVRNSLDYALNSVQGAAKGKVLDIDVGSVVIQRAVQRAVDQAPSWLLAKAGGPEGIAEKVYRRLDLKPEATEASTLAPAVAAIPTTR